MMTKMSVRIGLLMTTVAAVGAQFAAACGGDDPVAATPVPDAAPVETTDASVDTGVDAPVVVEAGPTTPGPFVSFLHDSDDYPEFTPCFIGADNTPINPSDTTIQAFRGRPITTATPNRWASEEVRLVALPKDSGQACDATAVAAIGDGGVTTLKTFPAGTFALDKSYVVMLLGCETADFSSKPWCYADWDGKTGGGTGTPARHVEVVEVDSAPDGAKGIGVQFIQASPAIQWNLGQEDGLAVNLTTWIFNDNDDTVWRTPETAYAGLGAAPPVVPAKALKTAPTFLDKQDDDQFVLSYPADGGQAVYTDWNQTTLAIVEVASTGKSDASYTYFQDGKNYVFIFVSPTKLARDGYLIGLPTRW